MNSDEIKALIVKLLIGLFTWMGTYFHMSDTSWIPETAAWLASGIVLAYGIYDHWNMKKVPENASIGMRAGGAIGAVIAIFALMSALLMLSAVMNRAEAADVIPKAQPQPVPYICNPTNCSGFYVGGSLVAEGGNGINLGVGPTSSIFAGGGAVGLNAGYQFWNGQWFAALEVDALYESQPSAGVANFIQGGFLGMVHTKLGGNLGALFGTSAPSPSQGPISLPQQFLANVTSAYVDPGCIAIRKNTTQYCGGVGVQLSMGGRWTADALYDYGAPTTKLNALQMMMLNVAYHF